MNIAAVKVVCKPFRNDVIPNLGIHMLKAREILVIIEETLQKADVFGSLLTETDRKFLIQHCLIQPAKPGKVLCRQNEIGNTLYLLLTGEVEITIRVDGETQVLGKLSNGDMFGEIAAIFRIPRIATVTTTKQSVVLEIPSEIFSELLTKNPKLQTSVYNQFHDRTVATSLRCVPFFNMFSDTSIVDLCKLANLARVGQGDSLLTEGEEGKGLFVITAGVARVHVNSNGHDMNVALLREGEYFGERSLLTGDPCTASISALTDISVVLLPVEEFRDYVKNKEGLKYLLDVDSSERLKVLDHMRSLPDSKQDLDNMLGQIQEYLTGIDGVDD